jgi:hypothetical protein
MNNKEPAKWGRKFAARSSGHHSDPKKLRPDAIAMTTAGMARRRDVQRGTRRVIIRSDVHSESRNSPIA